MVIHCFLIYFDMNEQNLSITSKSIFTPFSRLQPKGFKIKISATSIFTRGIQRTLYKVFQTLFIRQ